MPARVLWSEGLLLTPQHLQLSDQLHERAAWGRLGSLVGGSGGLLVAAFDAAALSEGQVQVTRIAAVLPDGSFVDAPGQDALPPSRALPTAATDRPVGVLLSLPRPLAAAGGSAHALSYDRADIDVEEWKIQDIYSPGKPRAVDVVRARPTLLLEGEEITGRTTLKIGEMVRDGSGRWQQSARYIPPVLRIGGSAPLQSLLVEVHTLMVSRRRSLTERRGEGVPAELTYADMLLFWFLYSLNDAIAGLEHALSVDATPPERVFGLLRQCVGRMTTFGREVAPMDLPSFRPDDLQGCFRALLDHLRRSLDAMLPTHHVRLPLVQQKGRHLWLATIPSDVAMDTADHILILSGAPPRGQAAEDIARAIKIAAARDIDLIVSASLRGVDLQPIPKPPAGVPARREATYFRLRNRGTFWSVLSETRELAVHLPGELSALEPELVVVP